MKAVGTNCRLSWSVSRLTSVAQCYDDAEVSSASVASLSVSLAFLHSLADYIPPVLQIIGISR